MDTNVLLVGALVAIVLGIIACFFGYRVFRIMFTIVGFIAGAMLGVALAGNLTLIPGQETLLRIIFGLVGGLIGAALAWFLYVVGVFLSGAGIGATIGASIALALSADATVQLILTIIFAVIVGVIAVALQKLFIILATAFGGAQLVISGGSQLLNGGTTVNMFNPMALLQPGAAQAMPTTYVLVLAGWLVLGMAGVLVQYLITSRVAKPVVVPTSQGTSAVVAPKDAKPA
ncbi:MAG TPA: DUF4203 domain-containing protein [Anaerolineae bacterium]|jgi:hypothetical protein